MKLQELESEPTPTPPIPATFEVSDINIIPIEEGIYGATAMLSNVGEESGDFVFSMSLDGEPIYLPWLHLDNFTYQNPTSWVDINDNVITELENYISQPQLWEELSGPDDWIRWAENTPGELCPGKFIELDGYYYAKPYDGNRGVASVALGPGERKFIDVSYGIEWSIMFMRMDEEYGTHALTIDDKLAEFELYPELNGYGNLLTNPIYLSEALTVFTMSYLGNSNFIVWLIDSSGQQVELLINEIGRGSGSISVYISEEGPYRLDVAADGEWSIYYSCQQ